MCVREREGGREINNKCYESVLGNRLSISVILSSFLVVIYTN